MFLWYLFPMLSKPARTKLYFVLLALCNLCVFLREAHSVTMALPHCHLQVRQRTEQNPLSEMHNQRWIFLEYKFYNTCSFGTLAYFRACRRRCVLLLEIFHSCTKAEVDPEQQLNPDLLYPQKNCNLLLRWILSLQKNNLGLDHP